MILPPLVFPGLSLSKISAVAAFIDKTKGFEVHLKLRFYVFLKFQPSMQDLVQDFDKRGPWELFN